MKSFIKFLIAGVLSFCISNTYAQTYGMVPTIVNGVVTLPIPGATGLSINVATGTTATPLQELKNDPAATKLMLGDDSASGTIPLGFTFPYFNKTFNNSWMYSNGIVSLQNGSIPGAGCCSGQDLRTLTNTQYNYSIMPLWTDLIDTTGSTTYYKRSTGSITYGWYGTKEYGTNNASSFEVKLDSSGVINTSFSGAIVTNHPVTSGMTGDLSKGEYFQFFHNPNGGLNINTATTWTTGAVNFDQCSTNPLSSTSCPTYQQAYHDQQCSINPLFAPDCPGYTIAFHDQQCNINQLSYTDCPGYAAVYLTQQCTASALYSPSCPGYQQAYFTQQCTANPLYNSSCPGYQQAYFNQQCSINPLYSSSCPGYQQAYHDQQCSLNTLYMSDCPGYAAAYRAQQQSQACRANSQSSPNCPGYVTPAAATTTVVTTTTTSSTTNTSTTTDTSTTTTDPAAAVTTTSSAAAATTNATVMATPTTTSTSTTTTSGGVVTSQSTTAPAAAGTVSASGTISSPTAVPLVADPVVNSVISNNNQTTTAVTATSAVAQSTAPAPASSPTSTTSTASTSTSASSSTSSSSSSSSSGSSSSQPQSARAAMVANLTSRLTSGSMSGGGSSGSSGESSSGSAPTQSSVTAAAGAAMKDADTAGSMEQQKEVQNVVMGAMSYVPGFDVYNVALRDVPFYKPYAIYGNQRTVDNRNAARRLFGATDIVHQDMVQQQYQLGN